MGRDTKESPTLLAGLSNAYHIGMLEVPNAAMNYLEAIRRCSVSEISTFHKRYGQSPQSRIPRRTDPKNATANNNEIKFFSRKS